MRIGVVSEGHADRAVIKAILAKATGLDLSDIKAIRPDYQLDETDLAKSGQNLTLGGWSRVKSECEGRKLINNWMSVGDHKFIVIHLDTAEAHHYGVTRPEKSDKDYCSKLRKAVVEMIQSWLGPGYSDNILHAVAVEEIEAWLLAHYSDSMDTSKQLDAKKALKRELGKKDINSTESEDNYTKLTKPILKLKSADLAKTLTKNCSLFAFLEEVNTKVLPLLNGNQGDVIIN